MSNGANNDDFSTLATGTLRKEILFIIEYNQSIEVFALLSVFYLARSLIVFEGILQISRESEKKSM